MTPLEMLSLACLALGAAAILRSVWLDSLRFADVGDEVADPARVDPRPARRLALQADAARVVAENENLSKAA